MDYYLAATTLEDEELAETLTNNDSVLLTESGEATGDGGLAAVVEDFEATVALAIGADAFNRSGGGETFDKFEDDHFAAAFQHVLVSRYLINGVIPTLD